METRYQHLADTKLLFGPEAAKSAFDPKMGLANIHPFDYNTGQRLFGCVRIGVITTKGQLSRTLACLNQLHNSVEPAKYGYRYIGFQPTYMASLDVPTEKEHSRVYLIDDTALAASGLEQEFGRVLRIYERAFQALLEEGRDFDVVIVYIPQRLEGRFSKADQNLRGSIKAWCAARDLKTQIVTDSALAPYDPCDNCWNLSLGIYVKKGGAPWKVDVLTPNICFVGIAFGIKELTRDSVVFVGLAEVFDRYGEHVVVKAVEDCMDRRSEHLAGRLAADEGLFLSEAKAQELLQEAIRYGYVQSTGHRPSQVIVHKTTAFKEPEIEGITRAMGTSTPLDLVHVKAKTDLRLYPETGGYPAKRGTFLILNHKMGLLHTTGVTETTYKGKKTETYLGAGTPSPLEIESSFGNTDITTLARQILALTKMNWNSTRVMNSEPITIDYARKVIRLLKAGLIPQKIPRDISYYI